MHKKSNLKTSEGEKKSGINVYLRHCKQTIHKIEINITKKKKKKRKKRDLNVRGVPSSRILNEMLTSGHCLLYLVINNK